MTTSPMTIQERIAMPVNVAARPGAQAGGMSVGDIVRILKQRMFLIIFIWIFMSGLAAGLSFYLASAYPKYRAKSAVLVESPFPKTPLQFREQYIQVDLMDRYVADQAVLLKDSKVLMDALQSAAILETQWYKEQPDKNLVLLTLEEELGVRQIPETSYLNVSFATKSPQDAPVIVNTVIEKYLDMVERMSRNQYTEELKDYREEEEQLENELNVIREQKRNFLNEIGTAGIAEGINVIGDRWRTLAQEVTRLEAEKLQHKAAYENLAGVNPSDIAISPQMMMMIQQDNQIVGMQNQKLALEQELMTILQTVGENHRSAKLVKTQIEVLDEKLKELMAQKEQEIREYQLNLAHTTFLNAMQAELQLREEMLDAESKQRDLDQMLTTYRQLEEDQFLKEHQLAQIREFINQLNMIIKDRGMVRVRQIGKALPPEERSFPRHELNIPGGSFLGLLLGIGLAFLLELVDTSVRTSQDIIHHVHVPLLGTVPDLDDEELDIEQIELASHTTPRSMIAESFRTIRTNLLLSSPAEQQRSVLITSARPEEGKTSVAVNMAISIAQSGRRVLIVDANFHRPMLHEIFPNSAREGLSNILIGQAKLSDLTRPTELPNVDVLTSGPIPPNPTELLAGQYLQNMLNEAKDKYDQIIIDGPPVLLVTDTLVMADVVDGVVLVCRAKASSRGAILRAREQLERVNSRIFGAILNAARVSRGGYFREQIRSYYDYQPEEALAAEVTPILPKQENGPENDKQV